jgi:hypothetical protein
MNFLLHRHLALRELGSGELGSGGELGAGELGSEAAGLSAAGLGAMLPDVWRMADRRMRARDGVGGGDALARGIAHHLEADRWFHRLPLFHEGERALGAELGRVGAPKLGLFGHIGWELCLDGALLLAGDLPATLTALRGAVRDATPFLRDAARAHGSDALADPERFERRVDEILTAIAAGPWIAGYRSGDGLVERLMGLRMRLGLAPLEAAQHAHAVDVFDAALERATVALPELLAQREEAA